MFLKYLLCHHIPKQVHTILFPIAIIHNTDVASTKQFEMFPKQQDVLIDGQWRHPYKYVCVQNR